MAEHTPGPWRFDGMGTIIADGDIPTVVADMCDPADARLIAAAPDLLDALRSIDVGDYPNDRVAVLRQRLYQIDLIRKHAIAKATG